MKITCFPHICNKLPAAPENETITLPIERITKEKTPTLNSSPNNNIKFYENNMNNITRGSVVQKINLVDC